MIVTLYRLDSMFWANGEFFQPAIYSAHLNGSGERKIITSDISEPGTIINIALFINDT